MNNTHGIRLGIIGLGAIGRVYARLVRAGEIPGLTLAAVCNRRPERMEAFPESMAFTDYRELLSSGKVDAVLIATPHFDHVPIGIAALEAGLHVMMEKPLAVHKINAERLLAAHRDPTRIFAIMYNLRTEPKYQWLKALIERGELGSIHRINWIITDWFRAEGYYGADAWRGTWKGEGGGVLLNQSTHQLDLWQWMFGMPTQVRAFCQFGRFHPIEVEDAATAYLAYANGTTGVFITTTGEAPGTNRLEVAADNGKVVIEKGCIEYTQNKQPVSEMLKSPNYSFGAPAGERSIMQLPENKGQHADMLRNFAAAIRGESPLIAPAEEGIHSLELVHAMLNSSFTNQVVDLPLNVSIES